MAKYCEHRYVVYNASNMPRNGADLQEAAWDDKMRPMVYDKLADAVNKSSRMKRIRNTDYSIYRVPYRGKGDRDPIASTARWAIIDRMEFINVGEYV